MELYTIKHVSEQLGVTYAKIVNAIYQGRLAEPTQKVKGKRLFDKSELERAREYFELRERLKEYK